MINADKSRINLPTLKLIFSSISRAFAFCAKNCPAYLAVNITLTLVNVASPYVIIYLWRRILDTLADREHTILAYAILYMAIQFICQLLMILQTAYQQTSRDRIDQVLKGKIIDKLTTLNIGLYDEPEFHRLFAVLNNIPDYSRLVDDLLMISSSVLSLIVTLTALLNKYTVAAAVILIFQIPTIIILSYNAMNAYKLWVEENDDRRRIGYYRDVMTNKSYAKEIQLYGLGSIFLGLYNNYWKKLYHSAMRLQKKGAMLKLLGNVLGMAGFAFLVVTLINKAVHGELSAGDIYYYIGLGIVLMDNTEGFGWSFADLYNDSKRCSEILDEYLALKSGIRQGEAVLEGVPEIEFKNVSFKYPGSDEFVLKNISFRLKAGEKMLLAGINGSGKTTIVKLILRMYEPTEGEILYNGIPAAEYTLSSIRARFGVLFQETELYARSFAENVSISKVPSGTIDYKVRNSIICTDPVYKKVLDMSGADKVRKKLANGDETELTRSFDDKGYEPSGGERQRIGLARAYFRTADFVILDEPSSAQDAISEDHIFSEFVKNYTGKSAVLISHRMSAASIVDKIAFIENGQLIAFGTHSEIYKSSDRYRKIYDMQAQGYNMTGRVR